MESDGLLDKSKCISLSGEGAAFRARNRLLVWYWVQHSYILDTPSSHAVGNKQICSIDKSIHHERVRGSLAAEMSSPGTQTPVTAQGSDNHELIQLLY